MANEGKLQSELAALKESLRIKEQSIANIDPKYQMNQAYLAKLKTEVLDLNSQISAKEAEIAAALAPNKSNATPQVNYGQPVRPTPYDDAGNLNLGYGLNDEGEPYWTGDPTYMYRPPVAQQDVPPGNTGEPTRPTPFDDVGNLNTGYSLDEEGNPVWVGPGYIDATGVTVKPIEDDPMAAAIAANQASNEDTSPTEQAVIDDSTDDELRPIKLRELEKQQADYRAQLAKEEAAAQGPIVKKETPPPPAPTDWRVRISLAPSAKYLYKANPAGILAPLADTNGVIFPYMPTISLGYTASYDSQSPTHSNFKIHNYQHSSVDQVTITGDFTAQDVNEANYMLAVIHFFRSATKMFYGQDQNPPNGTPPPLLYLSGLGQYQFDNHPMVLSSFTYTLPQDVDYINAYPDGAQNALNTVSLEPFNKPSVVPAPGLIGTVQRLFGSGLPNGAARPSPIFLTRPKGNSVVTRVPTKISISVTFYPIVTRNAISNKFSLQKYASGELLRGSKNSGTGGGIW